MKVSGPSPALRALISRRLSEQHQDPGEVRAPLSRPRSASTSAHSSVAAAKIQAAVPPTCQVCLEADGSSSSCRSCGSHTCPTCIDSYFRFKLKDYDVAAHSLVCPSTGCNQRYSAAEISRLVPNELSVALHKAQERLRFEAHPDVRWCPRKECRAATKGVPGKRRLSCSGCAKPMCFECAQPFHRGGCKTTTEDKTFVKWTKTAGGAKRCPGCRIYIQKAQGCDHMTCRRCHHEFCWKCLGKFRGGGHFCNSEDQIVFDWQQHARDRLKADKLKFVGFVLTLPITIPLGVALSPFILVGAAIRHSRKHREREERVWRRCGGRGAMVPASVEAQWTRDNRRRMRAAQQREAALAAAEESETIIVLG